MCCFLENFDYTTKVYSCKSEKGVSYAIFIEQFVRPRLLVVFIVTLKIAGEYMSSI